MKLRLTLLALASAIVLRAAEAIPLFNATLTVGKEHRFVLADTTGKTSQFLRVGESFEGYTIKSYDAKAGALDLERDGKIVTVTLVADAATANAPMATPATIADAAAVMNKIHIDELLERSIVQQKKMIMASIERMSANIPAEAKDDFAAFQKKIVDEIGALLDVGKMKADITRIYSETFTKEELVGVSAFYDTPLGQTLLAKQSDVQQKMQAAMMPRMAEIGPKIQQMSRDFAQQMKEKREGGATVSPAPAPAPKP